MDLYSRTCARQRLRTIERDNDRYGRDTLRYSSQGFGKQHWHMRRELMSKHFTTRWKDIPVVKCG